MNKSFAQYLLKNKIKDINKVKALLIGKKMTILTRTSGHTYQTGTLINNISQVAFYAVNSGHENTFVGYIQNGNSILNQCIYFSDFSVPVEETKSDFETRLKDLETEYKAERSEIEDKLQLMTEYELEVYDEDVLRINKALDVLESTKNRKAKVKALKELIN